MITLIFPYTDMQLSLNSLLVFGRKSQFLFLQSKAKGHAELLGSGGGGVMEGGNG